MIKESSQKPCQKPMFIVKNETFTGSDGSFFVPACPPNAFYWAFEETRFVNNNGSCLRRVLAPWLLLKQDILSEARYISQRCDFHRSACSLPSNGKLAHRDFLVLCGRCVNWPAFSLSSVCASCRASSCFDISGAGCASIPLPNSLSFYVILSVVIYVIVERNSTSSFSHPLAL